MEYIQINKDNIYIITQFFEENKSSYFRYYDKRSYNDAIKNHLYTVVLKKDNCIIGYGHIDLDDKKWLGIFIKNSYQNMGYGKQLMNHLIQKAKQLNIDALHLSVDKDNTRAIHIYQNNNFVKIEETDKYYLMCLTFDIITLPVSYGEAFDKLSILDIKLTKIKDERVNDVQKEYDMIQNKLNNLMTNGIQFHYKILKKINESIWDKQDTFRISNNINEKNRLCIEIIEENDRRFRVKNKINNLLSSFLKEQKGYSRKKAFILTHLGLGDHITSMGIVRYYSTFYDEMYLVCKSKYANNVRYFYRDDPTIKIFPIDTEHMRDDDISEYFGFSKEANSKFVYENETYDLITTGIFGPINSCTSTIPFCFYKDVELDYSFFWDYSIIIDTNESIELYNDIIKHNINDYIFIHTGSSAGASFSLEELEQRKGINRNETLIIDIEKNNYNPGHFFYEIAQKFVMKPIIFYKDTLINASQIYITDSCVFCFAILLNLKSDKCYMVSRHRNPHSYQHIFTEQYKFNPNNTRRFIYPF